MAPTQPSDPPDPPNPSDRARDQALSQERISHSDDESLLDDDNATMEDSRTDVTRSSTTEHSPGSRPLGGTKPRPLEVSKKRKRKLNDGSGDTTDTTDATDATKPAKRPRKEAETLQKRLAKAKKSNPTDVYVLPPPGQWDINVQVLFGYLGQQGPCEPVRQYLMGEGDPGLESATVKETLDSFLHVLNKAKGANSNKNPTFKYDTFLGYVMSKNTTRIALRTGRIRFPFNAYPAMAKLEPTPDELMYYGYIAAVAALFRRSDRLFGYLTYPGYEPVNPVGETNWPAEALHQAVVLLHFVKKQRDPEFLKKKPSSLLTPLKANMVCKEPQFMSATTADEDEDMADDDDGATYDVHQAATRNFEALGLQRMRNVKDYREDPAFVTKLSNVLEKVANEDILTKHKTKGDVVDRSTGIQRPRMSFKRMKEFTEWQGSLVVVKHDDPRVHSRDTLAEAVQERAADGELVQQLAELTHAGIGIGEMIDTQKHLRSDPIDLLNSMDELSQERYMQIQDKVADTTALTPNFTQCCNQLGYDLQNPAPYPKHVADALRQREVADPLGELPRAYPYNTKPLRTDDGRYALVLNPEQVTAIHFMGRQEDGPLKGGLLADDCGTGKTIAFCTHILERARAREQQWIAKGRPNDWIFKPTIIVCPRHLLQVWWDEVEKFFPDLRMWRYYDSVAKVTNTDKAKKTINPGALEEWFDHECPSNDPKSMYVVLETAYKTLYSRTLVNKADAAVKGITVRPVVDNPFGRNNFDPLTNTRSDEDEDLADPIGYDESDEHPPMTIKSAKDVFSTVSQRFERVIMDEAHTCRNTRTKTAQAIRLLQCRYVWMCTATPMLNRGPDFAAYLSFLWQDQFALHADDIARADYRDYGPSGQFRPQHTAAYGEGQSLDWSQHSLDLWDMDPVRFWVLSRQRDAGEALISAHDSLHKTIPMFMLRRALTKGMDVNGKWLRLSDEIPPHFITTVELGWPNPESEQDYKDMYAELISQHGGHTSELSPHKGRSAPLSDAIRTRNFAAHRKLGIMTLNPPLLKLIQKTGRKNMASDVEGWSNYVEDFGYDRGMTLYFLAVCEHYNMTPPRNRWDMSAFLSQDSPKLQILAKLVGDRCLDDEDNPGRVLVYTDWPMNLFMIEGFLAMIGFEVESIRGNMDANIRDSLVERFRDPDSKLQVLIASLQSSCAGMNLQNCCADLVLLCAAANINQILQAIGRIHRYGQTRVQRVSLVMIDKSYDQYMQYNQTVKMQLQLAGEGKIDLEATQQYEHIKEVCKGQYSEIVPDTGNTEWDDMTKTDQDNKIRARMRTMKVSVISHETRKMVTGLLGQRWTRAEWQNKNDLDQIVFLEAEAMKDPEANLWSPAKTRFGRTQPTATAAPAFATVSRSDHHDQTDDDRSLPPSPTPLRKPKHRPAKPSPLGLPATTASYSTSSRPFTPSLYNTGSTNTTSVGGRDTYQFAHYGVQAPVNVAFDDIAEATELERLMMDQFSGPEAKQRFEAAKAQYDAKRGVRTQQELVGVGADFDDYLTGHDVNDDFANFDAVLDDNALQVSGSVNPKLVHSESGILIHGSEEPVLPLPSLPPSPSDLPHPEGSPFPELDDVSPQRLTEAAGTVDGSSRATAANATGANATAIGSIPVAPTTVPTTSPRRKIMLTLKDPEINRQLKAARNAEAAKKSREYEESQQQLRLNTATKSRETFQQRQSQAEQDRQLALTSPEDRRRQQAHLAKLQENRDKTEQKGAERKERQRLEVKQGGRKQASGNVQPVGRITRSAAAAGKTHHDLDADMEQAIALSMQHKVDSNEGSSDEQESPGE